MEIIHKEKMTAETDDFSIERQKNSVDGKWYGLCISRYIPDSQKDEMFADNESWIIKLYDMKYSEFEKANYTNEYHVEKNITKKEFKTIRRLVRMAKKLGWF